MRPSLLAASTVVVLGFAALPSTTVGQTQASPRPSAQPAPLTGSLVIDGRPTETEWTSAPLIDGFVQREPVTGQPATERTEVRILYDDEAIYVAAWLYDSDPDGLVFGETRRDASLDDTDSFLFILDTYRDRQNGFVFGTSPAGIEYDGQVTQEGQGGGGGARRQVTGSGAGFNLNWDGSWEVATSRDSGGWYAEFRIPFSTLRFRGGTEQEWGLNMVRRVRRKREEAFWAPLPRQFNLYRVSMAGQLDGFEAPFRPSATVTPYVLGSTRWDYSSFDPNATTVSRERVYDGSADFGGDAKIALGPSLALDLTANTDFAQVEVDDQQVNLTRFQLFFPEKRPFFLENAGTFSFGTPQSTELFFSRRIGISGGAEVPIDAGGRLTGRVGDLNIGVLNIQTRGVDGVTDAQNYGAARVLKEWNNRSRLGGMFVSRVNTEDSDDHNYSFGLDGRLGIGDAVTFNGYFAATETPGVDEDAFAFSGDFGYTDQDWGIAAAYREVRQGFNPEVGFLPRTDYRFVSARVLRKFRFPDLEWFREWRPHVSYQGFWSLDGFHESGFLHIDAHFEFSDGSFFQLPSTNIVTEGLEEPFEISEGVVVQPGSYTNFDWGFAYNTNRSAPLALEGRINLGGFYSGARYGTTATVTGRMGDTFVAALTANYNDVRLEEGDFKATLLRLRTAYSFTPRIYVQALVQYNDQTNNLSSNLRLGWLNTAGTGLFIVFNDLEYTGTFLEDGEPRGPIDRTLVIKFTRQFNLGG